MFAVPSSALRSWIALECNRISHREGLGVLIRPGWPTGPGGEQMSLLAPEESGEREKVDAELSKLPPREKKNES